MIDELSECEKTGTCSEGMYARTLGRVGEYLEVMSFRLLDEMPPAAWNILKKIFTKAAARGKSAVTFRAARIRATDFKLSRSNLKIIRFFLEVFVFLASMMKVVGVWTIIRPLAAVLLIPLLAIMAATGGAVVITGTTAVLTVSTLLGIVGVGIRRAQKIPKGVIVVVKFYMIPFKALAKMAAKMGIKIYEVGFQKAIKAIINTGIKDAN